jgi:SMC interacting uncharacterized protein involved in chromosome segregation
MEAMRESWTDDRLDDLNGKVDSLRIEAKAEFAAVRGEMKDEFASVRAEMREGFERIEKRFDKVDERFEKVDARFEKVDERFQKAEIRSDERFEAMMDRLYSMQRLMIQFCGVAMTALIGLIATQI